MNSNTFRNVIFTAALMLGLLAFPAAAFAQDEPVSAAQDEGGSATGLLQVSAISCASGGETGTVAVFAAGEFAPGPDCIDGASQVMVDGAEAGQAAPFLEIELAGGPHTVMDAGSGIARDFEILPGEATAVLVVAFTTPEVEAGAEPATATIRFVVHLCSPAIQSTDDLFALAGLPDRLAACPAITLPGNTAPAGSISGGEEYIELQIEGSVSTTLTAGAFAPDQFCESQAGYELDNDPNNDACFSRSGYDVGAPTEALTVTQVALPEKARFGAVETGDPVDSASVTWAEAASAQFGLDPALATSGSLVVHVYDFVPPQVGIVVHLCPENVASAEDLTGLGGFAEQVLACGASPRAGDGGTVSFDYLVTGADGVQQSLDTSLFSSWKLCERDLDVELNSDAYDNECIDTPGYAVREVERGSVSVSEIEVPGGYTVAGWGTLPSGNDANAVITFDDTAVSFNLDTTFDGDVTLHLFYVLAVESTPEPDPTPEGTPAGTPSPSPEPTATPGEEYGSIQVVALYCLGDVTQTTVTALAPGAQASAGDLGDSSCFGGNAEVQIVLFGDETLEAFSLGRDGVAAIDGLPVTSVASGAHRLVERLSGEHDDFDVTAAELTRIIVKVEIAQGLEIDDNGVIDDGPPNSPGPPVDLDNLDLLVDDLVGATLDDLLADDLVGGFPDDGISLEGGYDAAFFSASMIDDLAADKLALVDESDDLPGVGVGGGRHSPLPAAGMGVLAVLAFLLLGAGAWSRNRRAS